MIAVPQEPPCLTSASGSTAGLSSSRLRRRSHLSPCTTLQTVYLPSLARHFYPPSRPPPLRRTRRHLIRRIHRPPSCLCRARPRQALSQTCRASLMRTFARQAPRATMPCPRAHRRHSTASCALRLSQKAPNLVVGARSRFRCARHRRPTGTACLPGRGSDGWRRTIRVNLWMQEKLTGGACIGRLWQIADTAVQAVTRLHAIAATMATRSTSLHLNSRIRTKCEPPILASSLHFTHYHSHFGDGSALRFL